MSTEIDVCLLTVIGLLMSLFLGPGTATFRFASRAKVKNTHLLRKRSVRTSLSMKI
jgi:O-antigen/teichoic acid export membrane protein